MRDSQSIKDKTNCRRKVIANHEQGDKEVDGDCSDDLIATEWCNYKDAGLPEIAKAPHLDLFFLAIVKGSRKLIQ